jgi:tetratricopeptide (TPR) repeat protein
VSEEQTEVSSAVANAERFRLEGRWDDALAELGGQETPDAWLERIQILSDQNLLARDRTADIEDAVERLAELAATAGDPALEAFVVSRRGLALHVQFLANPEAGEPPEEMPLFERALEIRERLGDPRGIAESLFHIGLVHQIARKEDATALTHFRRSYELAREAGDGVLMSYAIRHVGSVAQAAGNLDAAKAAFEESLKLREEAGWRPGIAAAQLALAATLAAKGQRDEARRLASAADRLLAELDCDRLRTLVTEEVQELTRTD